MRRTKSWLLLVFLLIVLVSISPLFSFLKDLAKTYPLLYVSLFLTFVVVLRMFPRGQNYRTFSGDFWKMISTVLLIGVVVGTFFSSFLYGLISWSLICSFLYWWHVYSLPTKKTG